jgi:hypothetical protein
MDWFWNWAANVSGIGTGTACSLISARKLEDSTVRSSMHRARTPERLRSLDWLRLFDSAP